jgi:hypothetical protein
VLCGLLAAVAPLAGAGAQDVGVAGRVVHDTSGRPASRQTVVLHAMTRGGGGPVDSIRTDAAGRYAFRVARVDSAALYVVSTEYDGIAYFSEPLVLAGRLAADFGALVVYDTTSSGPPIQLALRYLDVGAARSDGTHEVLETIELLNSGNQTRVAPGDAAVWQGALPAGIVQWQVGEGDVSAEAVARRGDSVAVYAALTPGGTKQLTFAYVTPATMRELRIPLDQPITELLLLVEDTLAPVSAPGLERLAVQEVEGRRYARYRARAVAAGGALVIALPARGVRAERLVPWIVGAAAAALVVGLVLALRKPRVHR